MGEVGFSYLETLNDVQRQAVTTLKGPVMVIAGPGSGKTRVLTFRIAHLLNNGVTPGQILALTFTNKAAREMKERIEKVAGHGASKVWAGTFHSLFAKILRREATKIGFPNTFTIYDSDDSKNVIKEILKTHNLDTKKYPPNQVLSRISSSKSNLITPKLYKANAELMEMDLQSQKPMLHMIYEKYVEKCSRAGAMDFDDLLLMMYKLLYLNPDGVRQKYQRQFKYVLVDEFQDTNNLQYEIVKLLVMYDQSEQNVCIVGDDAQSIYSFRGATIENILQFQNDFPTVQVYKLEQNYRSTSYIVNAANEVITHNKKQIQKKIWTEKGEGQKIKIVKAMTENEEGKRIANMIIEQKNRYSLRNQDFAILYRNNSLSRVFEESLRRNNINYKVFGGLSFYQRKEVKDIVSYIRLVANDKDDEALKRIINYPRRGIGNTTLTSLIQLANDNNMSLWDVLTKIEFNSRAKKTLGEFVQLITEMKSVAARENAYDAALFIARQSGIQKLLRQDTTIEGQSRLENFTALLDGIKEFVDDDTIEPGEEVADKSLTTYLQSISLMTDADKEEDDPDKVTLMSIHSSKGLEFKSVFVVGVEESLFPSFQSASDPQKLDEERRLFYVAITRAEEYLTLSCANSRYQYGDMRYNDKSRFLDEISLENIDPISSITRRQPTVGGNSSGSGQKLQGNFRRLKPMHKRAASLPPSDFTPTPSDQLKEGDIVMHLRFGKGKIVSKDGDIAVINFTDLPENSKKKIALKYAKLQVIDQ